MSDTSQPAAVNSDLSHLTPTVAAIDGADPELVAIGERYWAMAGFHPDLATPAWCEKAADIDSQGWGKPLYVVAAAGVRATVADQACPQCGGPATLTSRTALAQVCNGQIPPCVECTDSLQTAVQAVLDPRRKAKRDIARKQAEEQRIITAARDEWTAAQRQSMAVNYAFRFNTDADLKLPVREMLATLALLRYAPSTTQIRNIGDWPGPLHPDRDKVPSLLGELVRSGLIAIHPQSPVQAVVWEPKSLEVALASAEGDLDAVAEPQEGSRFYPLLAHYYAPYGTSAGTGATLLDDLLNTALAPERLTSGRQDDLLALAQELLTAEAVRYFQHRLDEVNLPAITETHRQRLEDAASKAAAHRPLGELYNLVWRSTRAAAEAAQKNPRAPRINMSTHAVNQFETHAHRAAADSSFEINPFNEVSSCPLAAMTRTLLYTVLDRSPFETSLPDIKNSLPEPAIDPDVSPAAPIADQHLGDLDDVTITLQWMATSPDAWDANAIPRALERLNLPHPDADWNVDIRVIQRATARLQRLHAHLLPTLGQRQSALAVMAASSDLLTHPTTDPTDPNMPRPVGKVIWDALAAEVLNDTFDPPEDLAEAGLHGDD